MRYLKYIFIVGLILLKSTLGFGEVYRFSDSIRFYLPDGPKITYRGKEHDSKAFHKRVFKAVLGYMEKYFRQLDPKFKMTNYNLFIVISHDVPEDTFGYYDWRFIFVRSFDNKFVFCKKKSNLEIYSAFIAHEISHAILHQRNDGYKDVAAHEYFAYNVMFEVMRPIVRNQLIRAIDVGAFESAGQITVDYVKIHPQDFAIRSYLHRIKDGGKLFIKIWNGEWESDRY